MTLSTINSHSSKANYKMFTSQGNQLVNRACCDSAPKTGLIGCCGIVEIRGALVVVVFWFRFWFW